MVCQFIITICSYRGWNAFDQATPGLMVGIGLLVGIDSRLQLPQKEANKNAVKAEMGAGCLAEGLEE
jgi:hypothetical protein